MNEGYLCENSTIKQRLMKKICEPFNLPVTYITLYEKFSATECVHIVSLYSKPHCCLFI